MAYHHKSALIFVAIKTFLEKSEPEVALVAMHGTCLAYLEPVPKILGLERSG